MSETPDSRRSKLFLAGRSRLPEIGSSSWLKNLWKKTKMVWRKSEPFGRNQRFSGGKGCPVVSSPEAPRTHIPQNPREEPFCQ